MGTERNYARFYALLKQMPYADKETLVEQYTHGRTTHLHETTEQEYRIMCDEMERVTGYDERRKALQAQLRKKRSACLRLMQQLGVNTTDWPTVDNFCLNPREHDIHTLRRRHRRGINNNPLKQKRTMAKRVKKIIITGVTREAADEAFAKYAKADAESAKITADIELQCAKIREKYAGRLAELDAAKTVAFDTLQSFATENQAELFSKKKSLDMAHGVIGFRTGTPKLKTLKGFTWASALQLVKEFLPSYVRKTEEVAKDKLLADRDMEVKVKDGEDKVKLSHEMARCGIQVVQDETFYVEPKKEETA